MKYLVSEVPWWLSSLGIWCYHSFGSGHCCDMWRLNSVSLNNQWITEEIKEEIKNTIKMKHDDPKIPQIHGIHQKLF